MFGEGGGGGAGGIGSGCSCVAHLHWNSNGGLHFLACLCLLLDLNFLPALKMLIRVRQTEETAKQIPALKKRLLYTEFIKPKYSFVLS